MGVSWGFPLLWVGGFYSTKKLYEEHKKNNNLKVSYIFSQILSHQYRIMTYHKFVKNEEGMSYKKRKVISHCMRYTIKVHCPPKIMEVKAHSNTTEVKFPVTSCVLTHHDFEKFLTFVTSRVQHHNIGKFHTLKNCTSPTYCPR